jgi:hypothetical protein
MARSNQTMRLEEQELTQREKQEAFAALVQDITHAMPKSLWDIHDAD